MPRHKIQSHATTPATPDQAWAVVRDFCAPWHPAVATMHADAGGSVRRFTVHGEDKEYVERLTWFSDSERSYAYTHVAGIDGVQSYDARLTVRAASNGATVTMHAELTAPEPRAQEIAEGTKAIFDDGTKVIADLAPKVGLTPEEPSVPKPVELDHFTLDTLPQLAVTATAGDSDTLCLFLHGIGGNRSNWTAQLAAVVPHCRAATLDLRGYGDSSLGVKQSTVDDYCDDILHVAETLGAKRLILCGLSYGAWIATSFAMRHPDKLAALILSGGCTGMSEAGPNERDAFRLSREVPMNEGQTPADFAPSVVDVIAGPDASAADRETLLTSMQKIPVATYADALRCFTNPLEQFNFSKLNMPVLLMTGEHDRLAAPSEIKAVAERIWDAAKTPDVRYETIEGAGHVCNLEQPNAYNRILNTFLARVLA